MILVETNRMLMVAAIASLMISQLVHVSYAKVGGVLDETASVEDYSPPIATHEGEGEDRNDDDDAYGDDEWGEYDEEEEEEEWGYDDDEWDEEDDEEDEWDEEDEEEDVGVDREKLRQEEYHSRNYTWPLKKFVPNTPGWSKLMKEKFEEVAQVPNEDNRLDGYIQVLNSALLVPNFTEYGFGLARAPAELTETLREAVRSGYETARNETGIFEIDAALPNLFIDRPDLTERVMFELHPLVERWAGIPVEPYESYGFRLYRNQSKLAMHLDRVDSHVLSFILHIDSSDDAQPWPLVIEDFAGRTHEVILTPGDILLYESAKCWHGRPQRFQGSWYTSVFVHYHPRDWMDVNHFREAYLRVPPGWQNAPDPTATKERRMEMMGTGMHHPNCPNNWCPSTGKTIRWGGPGKSGTWIDPNHAEHSFKRKLSSGKGEEL